MSTHIQVGRGDLPRLCVLDALKCLQNDSGEEVEGDETHLYTPSRLYVFRRMLPGELQTCQAVRAGT